MWLVVADVGTPQILTIKNAYNNQWHSFNTAAKPKKERKEIRYTIDGARNVLVGGYWYVCCVYFAAFFNQWLPTS